MRNEETWKSLCNQLYPRDAGLTAEVNLALADPEGYYEEFQEELANRGIDDASSVTAWLALVDGLTRRNSLAEVDWKCDATDLAWNLAQLQICKDKGIEFSIVEKSEEDTEGLLRVAAKQLRDQTLELMALDIDSDSYPLVVVPRESVPHVKRDAKILLQKVDVVGGE